MKSMKRLLRMTHLATSQPVEVELTDAEMTLSKAIDDASWEIMCNSIELDTLGGRPLH